MKRKSYKLTFCLNAGYSGDGKVNFLLEDIAAYLTINSCCPYNLELNLNLFQYSSSGSF